MKNIFLIFFSFLSCTLSAQTGTVTTIAGNGLPGDTGDGGPATQSRIGPAAWCIFDVAGNLYFTLSADKIRVVKADGTIQRAAGTGNAGYNGDNILAITADLGNPKQTALDRHGNLYIADDINDRIRKVDAQTGIITTIAGTGLAGYSGNGGPAINAEMELPYALCIDPFGNIYVGEQGNSVIRKIDTFGNINIYAGVPDSTGYSGDNGPAVNAVLADIQALCSDRHGNIYMLCGGNVRKIDAMTQIITTVAGNFTFGYNGDNIPATTAAIQNPLAITVDNYDNLYIADTKNNRIRMVDTFGIIHTIVGSGIQGFNGENVNADSVQMHMPEGVAVDSCGNVFYVDLENYRIRKVTFHPNCFPESIKEVNTENEVSLYPNPAKEQLSIACASGIKELRVLNTIGQVLIEQRNYSDKAIINVSALSTGIYFIKVSGKNGVEVVRRFLKE